MQDVNRDHQLRAGSETGALDGRSTLRAGGDLSPSFLDMGRQAGLELSTLEALAAWSSELKRRVMAGEPLDHAVSKASPRRPAD